MIGGVQRDPKDIAAYAHRYFLQFLEVNQHILHVMQSPIETWEPPPVDFVKINVDGAVFQQCGEIGLGVIVRDANGVIVAWRQDRYASFCSAECVEALATKMGFQLAIDRGWQCIIIEGDCANVLRNIESNNPTFVDYGNILNDIGRMRVRLGECRISIVRRQVNEAAHNLTRSALNFQSWPS